MAHIVVVDDNVTFREMIAEVLAEGGHTVVAEERVAPALIRLHLRRPDLVIVDMWMEHPDSGLRLARTLHDDPATRGIPMIICSAHADAIKAFKRELDGLGCVFISKPFDIDRLLAVVQDAIGPKEAHVQVK